MNYNRGGDKDLLLLDSGNEPDNGYPHLIRSRGFNKSLYLLILNTLCEKITMSDFSDSEIREELIGRDFPYFYRNRLRKELVMSPEEKYYEFLKLKVQIKELDISDIIQDKGQ